MIDGNPYQNQTLNPNMIDDDQYKIWNWLLFEDLNQWIPLVHKAVLIIAKNNDNFAKIS